jgi:hypothetical protein
MMMDNGADTANISAGLVTAEKRSVRTMCFSFTIHCVVLRQVHSLLRGTRWRICLRHCATSRKVAGSTYDGVILPAAL